MKNLAYLTLAIFALTSCSENEQKITKGSPTVTVSQFMQQAPNGRTEAEVVNPNGNTYVDGNTVNIQWDFVTCLCGNDWTSSYIKIELYKGANPIKVLTPSVAFFNSNGLNSYNWTIPYMGTSNSTYRIKITDTSNASNNVFSNYFTINYSDNPIVINKAVYPNSDGGTFTTEYRINGGSYLPFSGPSISLSPGNTVQFRTVFTLNFDYESVGEIGTDGLIRWYSYYPSIIESSVIDIQSDPFSEVEFQLYVINN